MKMYTIWIFFHVHKKISLWIVTNFQKYELLIKCYIRSQSVHQVSSFSIVMADANFKLFKSNNITKTQWFSRGES